MFIVYYMYNGLFRILANSIWPCCLCLSSTYATYFDVCLLNFSHSDLAALLIESLHWFDVYLLALKFRAKALNASQQKSSCIKSRNYQAWSTCRPPKTLRFD